MRSRGPGLQNNNPEDISGEKGAWDGIGLPPDSYHFVPVYFSANALQPVLWTPCKHQAWDWTLVLLSQGIEPTLIRDRRTSLYGLVLSPSDWEPALKLLHQYELENQQCKQLPQIGEQISIHWAVIPWMLFICILWWLQDRSGLPLDRIGAVEPEAIARGEVWRFLTATMIHADVGHLASNLTAGLLLIGLAMNRYGAGLAYAVANMGGIFGNVVAWLVRQHPYIGLGASGVVMAALGLLAAWAIIFHRVRRARIRQIWAALFAGLFLFLFFGIGPRSDIVAHVAGFACGLTCGILFGLIRPQALLHPTDHPVLFFANWLLMMGSWTAAALYGTPVPAL